MNITCNSRNISRGNNSCEHENGNEYESLKNLHLIAFRGFVRVQVFLTSYLSSTNLPVLTDHR